MESVAEESRRKLLLTGVQTMLAPYLEEEFGDWDITSLGRGEMPPEAERYELVVHADTSRGADAEEVNLEATRRLVSSLAGRLPKAFVFISDVAVYGRKDGENLDESTPAWASDEYGRTLALAESMLREWASDSGVRLTILRPALMLGRGVEGFAARMFRRVAAGSYIHLRGNDARLSLVMADDVAKAAAIAYAEGGVYNLADGVNPTLRQLAEAMSANAGATKRPVHLPEKWAMALYRITHGLGIRWHALEAALDERTRTSLTYSGEAFARRFNFRYYNALDVTARRCPDYPYRDK